MRPVIIGTTPASVTHWPARIAATLMGTVIKVEDSIEEHFLRCAREARKRFGDAVCPLYTGASQGRPEVVASAALVEIDGARFVVTAHHALTAGPLGLAAANELVRMPIQFIA